MNHKKNIIILTVIFIIFSILNWGKIGNILIDFSREAYIPYDMNNSRVLIKDIFLIYGAFGYIINSFVFKISQNINLLFLVAHLISYAILILFYYILNFFFTKKVSLIFSVIFLIFSIFSNSTFSFVVPYSYSTIWSILGLYGVIYSILYNKKIPLFLFLGLILANKIEYFIPAALITFAYLICKKEKFLKEFFLIFVIPLIPIFYLIFSKITFDDIIKNYLYIKAMLNANALKSLYLGLGCFFEFNYFKFNLFESMKIILILIFSYLFILIKKPEISYIVAICGFIFINCTYCLNLIMFFTLFITIFMIFKKNISKEEIILFLFCLILCSKSIFAINSLSYSNFGYCLIICYSFLQLQKITDKKWLINILIIFFIFCLIDKISFDLKHKKFSTKTSIGRIWLDETNSKLFYTINKFIEKNVKKDETFVIVPEGQIFNLIHKKPWNYYNTTFTPLDFETFGEKNLIDTLKKNQTDYIIFYPRNTLEYGAQTICWDWGVDFCKYIMDNYTQVGIIEYTYRATIFKIKNEKERNNRNTAIRVR